MLYLDKLSLERSLLDEEDSAVLSSASSSISDSSKSSCSINLEEETTLNIISYSKGFLAGNYTDSDDVPSVFVEGVDIKGQRGLDCFEAKQLQTYLVKRVLSPFEFYLERESDTNDEEKFRHKNMQQFYEREERYASLFSIKVSKMKCYAYYDPVSRHWWRIRVLDYQLEDGKNRAYVYYCDTGKQGYILCEHLRQLQTSFQGAGDGAILKCYLYDIIPINGDMHWPLDAIVFFQEIISDMRLGAIVMKFSKQPVAEHSPDFTVDCGVVLVDQMNAADRPDTFNSLLVKMGYARSIGITSCSSAVLDVPGMIPFCTTFEICGSSKTNENIKTEVSNEELHVISSRAISNSVRDGGIPLYVERPFGVVKNWKHYLPPTIRSRLAWVQISCVEGPGRIFIHMHDKLQKLKAMELEMQQICEALPQPPLESISTGSLITCRMNDPVFPQEDSFCRAVVLKMEENAMKVLMIDYGNRIWVPAAVVYQLPDKYQSIPSFAHRIHLDDVKPNYDEPQWHSTINYVFLKYLLSHEEDWPLYYLHVPHDQNAVEMTDLHQCVVFNNLENQWIADCPSPSLEDENAVINSMRKEPLLATHFTSKAASIFYEVEVDEVTFWDFANLSDFLVNKEYATDVGRKLDKNKIHEIIQNGFGSL